MKELSHIIKQIYEGKRALDERRKYQVISALICLGHMVFTFAFFEEGVTSLFIYNFVIDLYYLALIYFIGTLERYEIVFVTSFLEIMIHSILASVLVGWDWGFMFYTMGLIPFAFYVSFTFRSIKRKVEIPLVVSILILITYMVVKGVADCTEPILGGDFKSSVINTMYYFNTLICFSFLFVISAFFAIEVRFMQMTLEAENNSLEEMAHHDPLTKLLNRRSMGDHFKDVLQDAVVNGKKFSIIMADIDDFKQFNDTYGHSTGDAVLINVANMINSCVGSDDFVCRWGGEEFLILVKADKDHAMQIAHEIRSGVEKLSITVDDKVLRVTLTLGVAGYEKNDTIKHVIEEADRRLYAGKNSGKNRVM